MQKPTYLKAEIAGCAACQGLAISSIGLMKWPCFPLVKAAVI
jgi:hypothetical protein